jgi:hypothetical protein
MLERADAGHPRQKGDAPRRDHHPSEGGHTVTVTPRELAHASSLHSALAELTNAAIAARPIVHTEAKKYLDGNGPEGTLKAVAALERLDAALADAGETLAEVRS